LAIIAKSYSYKAATTWTIMSSGQAFRVCLKRKKEQRLRLFASLLFSLLLPRSLLFLALPISQNTVEISNRWSAAKRVESRTARTLFD